jgi:hypothetical protein
MFLASLAVSFNPVSATYLCTTLRQNSCFLRTHLFKRKWIEGPMSDRLPRQSGCTDLPHALLLVNKACPPICAMLLALFPLCYPPAICNGGPIKTGESATGKGAHN